MTAGLAVSVSLAACTILGSPAPTTSLPPVAATEPKPVTTTTVAPLDITPEVGIPEGDGPFPVVVLVHGGGWVAGDTGAMRPLARFLVDQGFITVNTEYELASRDSPGFPYALDDVACAVRFARSLPEADDEITLLGHSAGAHLAAVVALTGDEYGDRCPYLGSAIPERLVGLAGPYDAARVGILMVPFFGGSRQVAPDAWAAGNPQLLAGENPDLRALLLHGDADGIVSIDFSFDFADALIAAGSDALVEVVEGANHEMLLDPDVVGNLIVTWLLR